MFELGLLDLDEPRGLAAQAAARERGAWPLHYVPGRVERRWYGIHKSFPPELWLPTDVDGAPILSPGDQRDQPTLGMNPVLLPRLAQAIAVVAEVFPGGFTFRATFAGSPVTGTATATPEELEALILESGLNEFTRYRVLANPND